MTLNSERHNLVASGRGGQTGRMFSIAVMGDDARAQETAEQLAQMGFQVARHIEPGCEAVISFASIKDGLPADMLHLSVGGSASDEADVCLPENAHPIQIASRLRALSRLKVLEHTAQLRLKSAQEAGYQPAPVPLNQEESTVLFVGAPGPSFMRLQFAMSRAGIQTIAAFSTFNAFDYLHERTFDAVILNTRPDAGLAHTVCSAMRRNTRLYHTPAILLTADTDYAGADEAFARGASDILSDNASNDEMRDRVMALASERRRRRLAKARLEACRLPSLLDSESDLYNEKFGRVHMQSLMDHAAARLEPLSLIMLGVSAPQEAGASGFSKATNQFAGMLRHCVRAEDFVVRLAQDRFLIALPNTPQSEAKMVSNRVSAIAECTAYEGVDPLKPFRLELTPSIEDATGETSADALIEQMVRRSNVVPFESVKTG